MDPAARSVPPREPTAAPRVATPPSPPGLRAPPSQTLRAGQQEAPRASPTATQAHQRQATTLPTQPPAPPGHSRNRVLSDKIMLSRLDLCSITTLIQNNHTYKPHKT